MSFRIRAAVDDDLQHLYEMAKLTGGGFTNNPFGTAVEAAPRAVAGELDHFEFFRVARRPATARL